MNQIAVVICNWNKKEFVLNCIHSVLNSSIKTFDIIVVDNASTDGSVDTIRESYPDIKLIVNNENKGGSGGFNTGIKYALDLEYKYIHILDNDIVLDTFALENAYKYLENHPDVAAVGSKILQLDNPKYIQEIGASIDWRNMDVILHYANEKDSNELPNQVECDYVPACSAMIRSSVILEVGLMDESCFIYWDDIEWFYRMKVLGYKILAITNSVAWHKKGATAPKNTFAVYYYWRNKMNFFLTYTTESNLDSFADKMMDIIIKMIYMNKFQGRFSIIDSVLLAIDDAFNRIRGVAGIGRILNRENSCNIFLEILGKSEKIHIDVRCNYSNLLKVLNAIPYDKVGYLSYSEDEINIESYVKKHNSSLIKCISNENYIKIQLCDHLTESKIIKDIDYYVDSYFAAVSNNSIINFLKNYQEERLLYRDEYFVNFIEKTYNFRNKRVEEYV